MLFSPPRGGKKRNLTSIIKAKSVLLKCCFSFCSKTKEIRARESAATVKSKIEDGNIKLLLCLLSSDDRHDTNQQQKRCNCRCIANQTRSTSRASDRKPLPPPLDRGALQMSEAELIAAVKSFSAGSTGESNGIRPQHIFNLISNKEV